MASYFKHCGQHYAYISKTTRSSHRAGGLGTRTGPYIRMRVRRTDSARNDFIVAQSSSHLFKFVTFNIEFNSSELNATYEICLKYYHAHLNWCSKNSVDVPRTQLMFARCSKNCLSLVARLLQNSRPENDNASKAPVTLHTITIPKKIVRLLNSC